MNTISKTIAIAATVAGLAVAPIAYAHDDMQPMMQDDGGMGMMSQMNDMMSSCNEMMQAMMSDTPSEEGVQPDNG